MYPQIKGLTGALRVQLQQERETDEERKSFADYCRAARAFLEGMHRHTHTHTYTHTHTHQNDLLTIAAPHVLSRICVCVCLCLSVYIYACVHTHTRTRAMNINVHERAHELRYTYIQSCAKSKGKMDTHIGSQNNSMSLLTLEHIL